MGKSIDLKTYFKGPTSEEVKSWFESMPQVMLIRRCIANLIFQLGEPYSHAYTSFQKMHRNEFFELAKNQLQSYSKHDCREHPQYYMALLDYFFEVTSAFETSSRNHNIVKSKGETRIIPLKVIRREDFAE